MGLDMFIHKVNKTNHSIKELEELDRNAQPDNPALVEFLPLNQPFPELKLDPPVYSIYHQVAYWRKFNALHQWFVTNVQLGIDNCGNYEVHTDHLRELLEVLEEVFNLKNPTKLPPTQGFFWGSTQVDDYYWYDVSTAIKTISELIDKTDWSKERLFYQSSW